MNLYYVLHSLVLYERSIISNNISLRHTKLTLTTKQYEFKATLNTYAQSNESSINQYFLIHHNLKII